jgi:hypothetical protein
MILPTKRLNQDKALLTLGAEILSLLDEDKTVSRLWNEAKLMRSKKPGNRAITYDWFVLALTLLYTIGVVETESGHVRKQVK